VTTYTTVSTALDFILTILFFGSSGFMWVTVVKSIWQASKWFVKVSLGVILITWQFTMVGMALLYASTWQEAWVLLFW
jgi:hypothetical protein